MRSIRIRVLAGIMLSIPFFVLGVAYGDLPDHIVVLRMWDQSPLLWANKSLFIVFRVPVIGVLTAAAAGLMGHHFATISGLSDRRPVERFWTVILVTACAKSLLESIDLALVTTSKRDGLSVVGALTLATVTIGSAFAVAQLPRTWSTLKQRDLWRLTLAESWTLGVLALVYLIFAAIPIVLATRS